MEQTITPNPYVPCKPGWCLAYVNEAFGVPKRFGSASSAWNGSTTKHRDYNFPPGVWVPLWFYMPDEPLGHVVLRRPDGAIFSTTTLATTAYLHPNLQHLHDVYAHAGLPLVYLGWTEDVEGTPVMSTAGLALASSGTIIPQEDTLSAAESKHIIESLEGVMNHVFDRIKQELPGDTATAVLGLPVQYKDPITGQDRPGETTTLGTVAGFADFNAVQTRLAKATPQQIVAVIPENLVQAVLDGLAERLAK